MKTRTQKPIGALHPVLFFTGIYFVALLFSIFICSAIFYSCNTSSSQAGMGSKKKKPAPVQTEKQAENLLIASR